MLLRLLLVLGSVDILLWFSADVWVVFLWICFCLVMTLARWISLLLFDCFSLFRQLLLIKCGIEVLTHWRRETASSGLAYLHLLGWARIALLKFLSSTLVCMDHELLINLYWSMTNTRTLTQCSIWWGATSIWKEVVCCLLTRWRGTLVIWLFDTKLHILWWLISGWWRHLCLNIDCVHRLFNSIHLIKINAFWRFLCCCFTLVSTCIKSLGIAFHNLRLEWWNFLLIFDFSYVCRRRCNTSTDDTLSCFFLLFT